jgi:Domain of unknown function (DUF4328)
VDREIVSLKRKATFLSVGMAVTAAICLPTAVLADALRGSPEVAPRTTVVSLFAIDGVSLLAFELLFIAHLIWVHATVHVARAFGRRVVRLPSPEFAVAAHFIPVAGFYFPYRHLSAVLVASDASDLEPPRRAKRAAVSRLGRRHIIPVGLWWLTVIVGQALITDLFIARRIVLAGVVQAVVAFVWFRFVRDLTAALVERARLVGLGSRPVEEDEEVERKAPRRRRRPRPQPGR